MTRLVVALAAASVLLVPAGADAGRRAPGKRPQVVCFAKTVWVKGRTSRERGRMVRKRVCRPRRAVPPRRFEPAVPAFEPARASLPVGGPAPAAPAPGASEHPAPAAGAAAAFVCPDDSPWVGATAEDVGGVFRYRLSRTCVRAGVVWFDVRNVDLQQHDLWVRPASAAGREVVGVVDPAETGQGSAALSAGEWTLYCSIPGHGSMARALTVTPAG